MLFRKGSAVAAAAVGAASVFLMAGTAAAIPLSASQTVAASQPTGRQLKSALLPAGDLGRGYKASEEQDSGKTLERTPKYNVASIDCVGLWIVVDDSEGFGENAFATDYINQTRFTDANTSVQILDQGIYQFSGSGKAASFFDAAESRFSKCRSVTISVPGQPKVNIAVRSESAVRVEGHRAFQITAWWTYHGKPELIVPLDKLAVVDGDYVYFLSSQVIAGSSPSPSLASLMQKLIARRT